MSGRELRPGPPPRVGFIIDSLAPGAGTENQLLLLLRSFDRERVDPMLICLHEPITRPDAGPVPDPIELGVRRLASPRGMASIARLARQLRARRLDGLLTFFRDANAVGTLAGWAARVPVVSSRRNLGRGYWHTAWELRKLRALNRLTARFVANSCAVRDYTVAVEGVDSSRIDVIHNAIDTDRFGPAGFDRDRSRRAALGLPSEGLLVGCIANLRPVKNVDGLIRSFMRARALFTSTPVHLAIVGRGDLEPELRALATSLGLGEAVLFLGARQDTAELARTFDIAVLPSHAESFSNALLECAAVGSACVATDVGGNRELLAAEGRELGVLVPPRDEEALAAAIAQLASSETERQRLGQAAASFVKDRFSIPVVLERWYSLFEALKQRRDRGRL